MAGNDCRLADESSDLVQDEEETKASEPLCLANLNSATTVDSLAALFGVSRRKLNFLLYDKRRPPYRSFLVEKTGGGSRGILAPPPPVDALHKRLLPCLNEALSPFPFVHGFMPGRSTVRNARDHVASSFVLNLDLEDFFGSVNFGRVRGVFMKRPFALPENLASILAKLCCPFDSLPQGARTSPALSNLVCRRLDRELDAAARRRRLAYSRYADDLTFSTKTSFPEDIWASRSVGPVLTEIIERHGFRINQKKARLCGRATRQSVTGIVVNSRLNVSRTLVRRLRAEIHWASQGRSLGTTKNQCGRIAGGLGYLAMVRGQGDALTTRLALAANVAQVFPPPKISGDAAREAKLLCSAVWVLHGTRGSELVVVQGSCFWLAGFGLITAQHVVEEGRRAGADRFDAVRPSTNGDGVVVQLEVVWEEPTHDIALLRPAQPQRLAHGVLSLANRPPAPAQAVVVAGYPDQASPNATLFMSTAAISGVTRRSMVDYISTSALIHVGMSGGPILDGGGSVLGLVAWGAEGWRTQQNAGPHLSTTLLEEIGRQYSTPRP
jgi:S1-C subfamily serine protease